MLKRDPNYRRLRLSSWRLFRSVSFWLGPDHLLMVEVSGYAERYRRFFFRDIQAVLVQQSYRRFNINLILSCLLGIIVVFTLIFGGMGGTVPGDSASAGTIIFWSGVAAVLVGGLVINNLRGRTCIVHVQTAVQTQKLTNLTRWKKADRLLAELTPLVHQAQAPAAAVPVTAVSAPDAPYAPVPEPAAPAAAPTTPESEPPAAVP
ncbi:MAG TPA: hypothetical protein VL527_00060 [Dongiaceae bacterium]|nr:hypothetical protein [Dongiaceae bacterium]